MKNLKGLLILLALVLGFSAFVWFYFDEEKTPKTANDCEIPTFAKAIGHEDQWLLHNGCPPREEVKK